MNLKLMTHPIRVWWMLPIFVEKSMARKRLQQCNKVPVCLSLGALALPGKLICSMSCDQSAGQTYTRERFAAGKVRIDGVQCCPGPSMAV